MENTNLTVEGGSLDIGRCFNDALGVYGKNILVLILAAFLFQIISLFTLLILTGPLYGGFCVMMLNAMRKEDKKIELKDMFSMMKRFWPLLGLFLLQLFIVGAGFMLLIIPGFFLTTMLLYVFFIMVDKNKGIVDSIKGSWEMIRKKGFWMNFALCVIYLILSAVPGQIPFVGWLINLCVIPFAMLVLASAYIQQTSKDIVQETTATAEPTQ